MINRKIPWTTQPQIPVGVDWNNPNAGDLLLANVASLYSNQVNFAPPTRRISTVSHVGLEPNYFHANGEVVFSTPGIKTFFGRYLFDATNERFGGMFSSTNRSGIYFEYTSSQLKVVVFNNGAYGVTNIGSTPAAGEVITLGVVSDSDTSHRIYRNGLLVATLSNTAQTGTFNVAGAMYCDASTFYTAKVAGVSGLTGFSRRLSGDEIKELHKSQFGIFSPLNRRIWVAGAGGNGTATITGVSGSGQVGTLFPSGNASVSLSGAFGTGSVGSVAASVSVATTITGVSGTGSVGTTTQTGTANVTAPSAAGTGSVGTVSASGSGSPDGNVTITGIAGTGQVGTLAAAGNAAVSIAGVSGAGSVGSVTPSVTVSTTITGVSGTGSVGTTTQTGTANATVSSAVGIGLVGTVSATGTSQDGNAVISGISGIGSVGIVSANDGTVVNNHGFIIIDTEPRLWWKRKPSKLDDKKAEEKIFKVARVIERVVKHVANSNEPSVSKEVYRKAAYAEVAPLLREMPGFDWSPMFRAILTQSKLQEQNRIAAEQAGILAKQEIERIKRIRDDEEALIVLLMGA